MSQSTPAVLWFRRDLRVRDHPALVAAVSQAASGGVVPLFVLDPALWEPAGAPRRAWLLRSLHALDGALGGALVVRHGDPRDVVPALAQEVDARTVHVSADAGPYGRSRDADVAAALRGDGRELVRTGSPYAIGPGTLLNGSGEPFKVFSPFMRAWLRHGAPTPAPVPDGLDAAWVRGVEGEPLPPEPDLGDMVLPEAGEQAALRRWHAFHTGPLAGYADARNLPATAGTSSMSAHLKYGEIHPRTMLADLAALPDPSVAESYRSELCWRDFYADVLWHRPETAREYLRPQYARMRYDEPGERLTAWQQGRTGFPLVDAGMRQLRAEGWVHNRVRMVVASFLVKDLHVEWQHGARHFMHWLRDADLASNSQGWQWVAGSGTDAAPYFRVFNPVTQGVTHDPDGEYVRRYVPELRHLPGSSAHEPWSAPDGYAHGYPQRIVDHAAERVEALSRLKEIS